MNVARHPCANRLVEHVNCVLIQQFAIYCKRGVAIIKIGIIILILSLTVLSVKFTKMLVINNNYNDSDVMREYSGQQNMNKRGTIVDMLNHLS